MWKSRREEGGKDGVKIILKDLAAWIGSGPPWTVR